MENTEVYYKNILMNMIYLCNLIENEKIEHRIPDLQIILSTANYSIIDPMIKEFLIFATKNKELLKNKSIEAFKKQDDAKDLVKDINEAVLIAFTKLDDEKQKIIWERIYDLIVNCSKLNKLLN